MKKLFGLIVILGVMFSLIGCGTMPGPGGGFGAASDKWQTQCSFVPFQVAGPGVSYCISQTGANPVRTIWYLHGLMSSEKYFLSPGVLLDKSANDFGAAISADKDAAWVVSISFGPGWELTDYPNRHLIPANATIDNFKTFITWIEDVYKVRRPYAVMGVSEGGANTSVVAAIIKKPDGTPFFDKAVMIDAMIEKCDIYALWGPGVCPFTVLGPTLVNQGNYPDSATWNVGSPFARLKNAIAMPPLYVVDCPKDEWGLSPMDKLYAADAKAKGFQVVQDTTPLPCKHAVYNSRPILDFLDK